MRTHRALYLDVRESPVLVRLPRSKFLAIDGIGDPTGDGSFQNALGGLYALVYPLKFARKAGGRDFRVMPIEADWRTGAGTDFDPARPRSEWRWSARTLVPSGVSPREIESARRSASARRPDPSLQDVRLVTVPAADAVQVLHVGPYSSEGPTIRRLHAAIGALDRVPVGPHHEIYLSDPRRTAPSRIRTVLRQPVRRSRGGSS